MISEVNMRRPQVIPEKKKKNFEQFFPSMFLTNVCFKNYNKKNIGHHASYLFVLRSEEELTLGTSA